MQRILLLRRQGNVAVRPDQVHRIPGEAGHRMSLLPPECMNDDPGRAPLRQPGTGSAVDMHLPLRRRQRIEVVAMGGLGPGQTVAAVDPASRSLADGTVAILDHELGDRPVQKVPHRLQLE